MPIIWKSQRLRHAKYMQIIFLVVSFFVAITTAHAKEYGSYDLKSILTVSETPSGKKYGIDGNYLDKILNDLAHHARNYPPHFDTPHDRQRAAQDAKTLSGMLDIIVNSPGAKPELLLRAGSLNSIAYNLDIPGSAEKTSSAFQRLLVASPSHPEGNYVYGTFLAGAGKPKEAVPFLEKSLAVGVVDAAYTLGMTYLSLSDKQKALKNLENYQKRRPNDANVAKLIEAIRNGI